MDDAITAAGGTATLLPFDLADTKKIAGVTPVIAERFKRLDIFVGNAGMVGDLSPVAMSDPKTFEGIFKLNFFANYHLIRALDPLLRGSDPETVLTELAAIRNPFYAMAPIRVESVAAPHDATVNAILRALGL